MTTFRTVGSPLLLALASCGGVAPAAVDAGVAGSCSLDVEWTCKTTLADASRVLLPCLVEIEVGNPLGIGG